MTTPIPINMSFEAYLFSISRADGSGLRELRREIAGDAGLDAKEKRQLDEAVDLRFCWLNHQTVGTPKARWD